MPEYLAPGVFIEEVSYATRSIEGVPTSTTGFAGLACFGPVVYTGGPKTTEPRLITSFPDFERVYGGLDTITVGGTERLGYLAHAARAFFDNGGQRLYVSRVFVPLAAGANDLVKNGIAKLSIPVNDTEAIWKARWPGAAGNVYVDTQVTRTKNIGSAETDNPRQARRAKAGAVVEIIPDGTTPPVSNQHLDPAFLAVVQVDADGVQTFIRQDGVAKPLASKDVVQLVELRVLVRFDDDRLDVYEELGADPAQKRDVARILQLDDPEDENAAVWLDYDPTRSADDAKRPFLPALLMAALRGTGENWRMGGQDGARLSGGHDGLMPTAADLDGKAADVDHPEIKATGLEALAEVEDIAIVALPDGGTFEKDVCAAAADRLVAHAEKMRFRIALLDAPQGSSLTEVRSFRGKLDSKYAALYHPWVEIFDPLERPAQGAPPKRLLLPPSGFVAGIYARSDVQRGVYKAPANEVVLGLTRFEANVNTARQEVLNPEGVNCLRFFEGRGNRVWGARTISSDPEWRYVNVRRLFNFIEHSIYRGTQWAVFEPNNPQLWASIRQTIEDFLLDLWRTGALLGNKAEEAFFVRCDRTTMTQNDLNNGRLICQIGVSPTRPAEFVIFRIGQWTADSKK